MAIAVGELPKAASNGMTPSEKRHFGALERRIGTGLQTFREVGLALLEIRDSRLYRETHSTFEGYCTERWGMPRARAYQLIDSAKTVAALGENAKVVQNEAQARELVTLAPEVAKHVLAVAEGKHQPLTATLIRQVKAEVAPDAGTRVNSAVQRTPTEALLADITRLGHAYQRWLASKPKAAEKRTINAAMTALGTIVTP